MKNEPDRQPKVVALILVWNNVEDTKACVNSVLSSSWRELEVLLVDNGSKPGIVSQLRAAFPEVEIQETGANLGFSAGNNLGLELCLRRGAEFVFLLNQDTMVEVDTIERLVEFAKEHPTAGLIGPVVHCSPDKSVLYSQGGRIDWTRGQTRHQGLFEPADPSTDAAPAVQVDFVSGCGMLTSRRFIQTAGYLDPEYFFNYEDVEWAVRGRRRGFELWCVPGSRMEHKISTSLGESSPTNTYYMTRNALRFFWSNGEGVQRWLAVSRIFLSTFRTVAAWTLRPRYWSQAYRHRSMANLMAVRDFVLQRYGKMGAGVASRCGFVAATPDPR